MFPYFFFSFPFLCIHYHALLTLFAHFCFFMHIPPYFSLLFSSFCILSQAILSFFLHIFASSYTYLPISSSIPFVYFLRHFYRTSHTFLFLCAYTFLNLLLLLYTFSGNSYHSFRTFFCFSMQANAASSTPDLARRTNQQDSSPNASSGASAGVVYSTPRTLRQDVRAVNDREAGKERETPALYHAADGCGKGRSDDR